MDLIHGASPFGAGTRVASCLTDAANTPCKSHRRQNLRTHVKRFSIHILIIAVEHPPTVLGAPVTAATHQSVELL